MEVGLEDDRVKLLISIGTPIDKYDFGFLENCRKPLLLVHGERDEFGDVNELRKLVEEIAQNCPAKLVVVPNADHFFEGALDQLKQAISEWLSSQLAT